MRTRRAAHLQTRTNSHALREMALGGSECRPTLSHLVASCLRSNPRTTTLTSRPTTTLCSFILFHTRFPSQPRMKLMTSCATGNGQESHPLGLTRLYGCMDGVVGVSFTGVPIFDGTDERDEDPFYPSECHNIIKLISSDYSALDVSPRFM